MTSGLARHRLKLATRAVAMIMVAHRPKDVMHDAPRAASPSAYPDIRKLNASALHSVELSLVLDFWNLGIAPLPEDQLCDLRMPMSAGQALNILKFEGISCYRSC